MPKRPSKSSTAQNPKPDIQVVQANAEQPESRESLMARLALKESFQAASTICGYDQLFGGLEIASLSHQLSKQIDAVNKGSMLHAEGLLVAQAVTLDALFHSLSHRAIANKNNLDHFERLLRLGLKAQGQSRSTLETLGKLKNPHSVAFVRQANITSGPQQINNSAADSQSRAQETENAQNKLLESQNDKRMDTRAPGQTISADSVMAAVDEIKRT